MNVNSVLASLEPRYCSFYSNDTLDKDLTKSTFSQTRYTDSVLASLEPRLFHSKLKLIAFSFLYVTESSYYMFVEQFCNALRYQTFNTKFMREICFI